MQRLFDLFLLGIATRQHVFQTAHPVAQAQLADFAGYLYRRQPVPGDFIGTLSDGFDLDDAKDNGGDEHAPAGYEVENEFATQAEIVEPVHCLSPSRLFLWQPC
ncbi:MAG: hypothetical protein IPL58_00610 [Betaproteobacteria bacterium]|uniref:Uncharacterized protein n=1 Tax=Candidatus Proximibacter danicus TaxID=2954365 RepID=A0A9D7PP89_9PROT|nr:hypothetical protein [Candidatus Proximibacter danicus]